jgi:type IV secretory pathway protease TraF
MLGDNSAHSADSRYWGFAHRDTLKGRALCVYLPIKRIRVIK